MAVPQMSPPVYIIYRDVPPGEPYDATSSLAFFPPKGSDELFDALRSAFPHLKTHSERTRDAIIQFLLEERQGEQFDLLPATTMESSQLTWPSESSGSASMFSSPDMPGFATPNSSSTSPQTEGASMAASSQPSPPSLDQMTGVFSLSSNPQPKQRVRRKMTEAEKVEYRKRRIVKACEKCAKRKRKCPHNQAEMKTIPTPSTKSISPPAAVSVEPSMRQSDAPFLHALDESFDPTTLGSFGDFNMFDDPVLPEVSVDDFFHFEHFEDTSPLFNNANHDPFNHFTQHKALAHFSRNDGIEGSSRSTQSDHRAESPSATTHQVGPSSPLVDLSFNRTDPRAQTETHPSQRAVSDPHTGGFLSETRELNNTIERQSSRLKDHRRAESLDVRHHLTHATSSNRDDTLLDEPSHPNDMSERRTRPLRLFSHQVIASSHQQSALTSTSVSTQSGSSNTHPATLQGRPQPLRLSRNSDTNEGARNQRTLGEGLRREDDIGTELFRLRRRIPEMGQQTQQTSRGAILQTNSDQNLRGQQSPEQLSAQANGGGVTKTLYSNNDAGAAHRRPTNGAMAGSQIAIPSPRIQITAGDHQERLSDHVRYKDHHGRPQQGASFPQFAFALGAIALLAMFSPSISALGLALLLTLHSSSPADSSAGIVQCTTKNSPWLSTEQNKFADIGFRVLKERQHLRGSSSQSGQGLFEDGPGAWLMGLMYPFRLAPVSFAFV